ncbi:substance-P receptor-like [Littorina saxatilis]|uniref:G-protein coupled receptors family 1 profile domain-containing protein n=1 Tax=Littorina saxatilis TaxID=31220 RepID=A0AAN9BVF1_9CAEN
MSGCKPVVERNFSGINFPGHLPLPLPQWEVGLKIGACVLVEVVAVFGNLLVIIVVARSPRMRSTTNCYIANMAVADLLIALVPMWIHVTTDVISMDQDGWALGSFLCKFNSFVQVTAMVASVMTLMAIAGDRFFAIIFPLKARVTERRVGVVVVFLWLCALGIGLPPLFFYTYTERQWKDYLETFCTDVWPVTTTGSGDCDQGVTSKRAYWTLVTVVLNWLPMAVMSVVYAVIVHRLRFSRVQSDAGRNSMSTVQKRSKRKVVKMLLIVLVTFMICTIPFQVTNLYPIYSHEIGDKLPAWHRPVYFAAVFLMYTNSAINPILYGGLNEKFRHGARDFFNCILCRQTALSNHSMSTHLSVSRARVSLVEDEARKAKDKKQRPSLEKLAVSAAHITKTTLNPTKKVEVEDGAGLPRNGTVTFEQEHVVIGEKDGASEISSENNDSVSATEDLAVVGEDGDSLSSHSDTLDGTSVRVGEIVQERKEFAVKELEMDLDQKLQPVTLAARQPSKLPDDEQKESPRDSGHTNRMAVNDEQAVSEQRENPTVSNGHAPCMAGDTDLTEGSADTDQTEQFLSRGYIRL